tara:strand:- start:14 stop:649 length:636 start_codon:yes stop_codon:yes gene_type:complete
MKNESEAIKRLCDSKFKVSAHYFIKNNGKILILVPDLYNAWHAGISSWKNYKSLNKNSIGIEISNMGHKYGYKNFSSKQMLSLTKLLRILVKEYKINVKNVLGHSDIAPDRKKDPGEKFPWKALAKKKLSYWHDLKKNKIKKFRKIKLSNHDEAIFLKNLYKIGYKNIKGLNFGKNVQYLTKAFQRRFRQELVDGKIDKECFLISKNLIKL